MAKSTSTYEHIAVDQLQRSMVHLSIAINNLGSAAASIDDFPTARHEMQALANKAEEIKKELSALQRKLDIIKTK